MHQLREPTGRPFLIGVWLIAISLASIPSTASATEGAAALMKSSEQQPFRDSTEYLALLVRTFQSADLFNLTKLSRAFRVNHSGSKHWKEYDTTDIDGRPDIAAGSELKSFRLTSMHIGNLHRETLFLDIDVGALCLREPDVRKAFPDAKEFPIPDFGGFEVEQELGTDHGHAIYMQFTPENTACVSKVQITDVQRIKEHHHSWRYSLVLIRDCRVTHDFLALLEINEQQMRICCPETETKYAPISATPMTHLTSFRERQSAEPQIAEGNI